MIMSFVIIAQASEQDTLTVPMDHRQVGSRHTLEHTWDHNLRPKLRLKLRLNLRRAFKLARQYFSPKSLRLSSVSLKTVHKNLKLAISGRPFNRFCRKVVVVASARSRSYKAERERERERERVLLLSQCNAVLSLASTHGQTVPHYSLPFAIVELTLKTTTHSRSTLSACCLPSSELWLVWAVAIL